MASNSSTVSRVASNGEIQNVSNRTEEIDQQQADRPPPQSTGESYFSIAKTLLVRAVIIYFITSMFRRPQQPSTSTGGAVPNPPAANIFPNGTEMDMYVYLTEDSEFSNFESSPLVWQKKGLVYGDWYSGPDEDGIFTFRYQFEPSEGMKNNGSIYLHLFVVKSGKSPDPKAGKGLYSRQYTIHRTKKLNKIKKRTYRRTQNLLTGKTAASEEEIMKAESLVVEYVSHWHPNITINLVTDFTGWIRGAVPQPLNEYIEFTAIGDEYKPIIYLNDYWCLNKDYQPINHTTDTLNLTLTYQPLSMFKWQMYSAQAMRNKWTANLMGGMIEESEDQDQDSLKEAILETPIYLMVLTAAVSLLHSVFEFLAFKNDIQFWNNRRSLEGLSVRSVFFNVFQSLIVLLYVLDNETNAIVRISCGIGLLIEVWKIFKVVDVKVDRERPWLGLVPRIVFEDKGSYVESSTRQYDIMAFKYLSWALYPLLVGYAVYSLLYQEHTGWYSWILSMLYGFLLTFGFIMMTPQLFINYKLKSVAHLPWRMLTYKALNTFIDDIFAFIIKMPTMYRIGCFRDDIVFFIFLYQRYIYRVDPSRMNEFGYSQEMLDGTAIPPGESEEQPKPLAEKKED